MWTPFHRSVTPSPSSRIPIRWETGGRSCRFAAEEALRTFQCGSASLNSREVKDAYIHLIVGRGFGCR
jgi:hypothetical protein